MSGIGRTVALVALALTAVPPPASAQHGVGTSYEMLAGVVVASTVDGAIPRYDAHATCTYATLLKPGSALFILYGGAATATAVTAPPQLARQTVLECLIRNEHGHVAQFAWTVGGPTSVYFDNDDGWPARRIELCARARGYFGPAGDVVADTGFQCTKPFERPV